MDEALRLVDQLFDDHKVKTENVQSLEKAASDASMILNLKENKK